MSLCEILLNNVVFAIDKIVNYESPHADLTDINDCSFVNGFDVLFFEQFLID